MLLHLPPMPGRDAPRVKNVPPLTGSGGEAVRDAIATQLAELPAHLRRSLTWDQGAEMAQHARLRIDTGLQVFFCDPQSPWQRGTNENTNGLLRQYFPKGTDLARHSADDLAAVADALNSRPRKTLGGRPRPRSSTSTSPPPADDGPQHRHLLQLTPGAPRPRAWLSPLRPALRASLRGDSHAAVVHCRLRTLVPATVRSPKSRCCDDPLSPG